MAECISITITRLALRVIVLTSKHSFTPQDVPLPASVHELLELDLARAGGAAEVGGSQHGGESVLDRPRLLANGL